MASHSTEPEHSPTIPSSETACSAQGFLVSIVGATALAHGCNDMIQAVLPSIYPMLKASFAHVRAGWSDLSRVSDNGVFTSALGRALHG
jgi:hypothetical protein